MRRSLMHEGEVYRVSTHGARPCPMVLASVQPVTMTMYYREDETPGYRITQGRSAMGDHGGGPITPGGSITGLFAVMLPTRISDEVDAWLAHGNRSDAWLAHEKKGPAGPLEPVTAAYRLARFLNSQARRVSFSSADHVDLAAQHFRTQYRAADGYLRTLSSYVINPRSVYEPWAEIGAARDAGEKDRERSVLAIRERLRELDFWNPVSFEGDTVRVPLSTFDSLLDLISGKDTES